MYVPKHFLMDDVDEIIQFVKEHSFASLVSVVEGVPYATHVPFLVTYEPTGEIVLHSHLAKANKHVKYLHNSDALIIFSGPHAYISNKWYNEHNNVSTWNYIAVHMYGQVNVIENDEELYQLLKQTTETYGHSFNERPMEDNDANYLQNMMKGIVGFHIRISKVEGKWKLSQNHPQERRRKVIEQLEKTTNENSQRIATYMKNNETF